MTEDVLLIEEHHQKAATVIIDEIIGRLLPKFIVAVSGESGSGKSELSHLIAKGLCGESIIAKVIHTDNFYRILPQERRRWREENGVEQVVGPDEYDWNKLNRIVSDFISGSKSVMPCVDLITQRVDMLTTEFSEIDLLVLDGLYAVNTPKVNLSVFIELTYHETKKAQSVRGKESTDEFRYRVLEAEHKAVKKLRSKADLLISKDYEVVIP